MAEIEPPSFSLGLDLDPPNSEDRSQAPGSTTRSSHPLEGDEEEFELRVSDSDIDDGPRNLAPTRLKRLRRGTSAKFVCPSAEHFSEQLPDNKSDDDIEEFSSGDDHARQVTDDHPSTVQHSVCSSAKISLFRNRILSRQLANRSLGKTRKQEFGIPASTSLHRIRDKLMFAELTNSPLRRFQLLDSDSDEPERSDNGNEARRNNSLKQREPNNGCSASTSKRCEPSALFPQKAHLPDSFCQDRASFVPTPALDEFCADYYKKIENKDAAGPVSVLESSFSKGEGCNQKVNNSKKKSQAVDPENVLPPALQYFFHKDPRTQRLVRSRLPYFFPLSASNNAGNKQQDMSSIDYMGQFSHGGEKNDMRANSEQASRKGRKKSTKSNLEEFPQASGSWVNPKHQGSLTKDAGKRRVHANDRPTGQWYTVNGKRVYFSRDGKELTGSSAYKHYRKESGKGLKMPKRKNAGKRKR